MLLKALTLSAALAVPALAAQTGADMGYPSAPPAPAQAPAANPHAGCPMMTGEMGQHHPMMDGSKGMMQAHDQHAMMDRCRDHVRHGHKKKHRHR